MPPLDWDVQCRTLIFGDGSIIPGNRQSLFFFFFFLVLTERTVAICATKLHCSMCGCSDTFVFLYCCFFQREKKRQRKLTRKIGQLKSHICFSFWKCSYLIVHGGLRVGSHDKGSSVVQCGAVRSQSTFLNGGRKNILAVAQTKEKSHWPALTCVSLVAARPARPATGPQSSAPPLLEANRLMWD